MNQAIQNNICNFIEKSNLFIILKIIIFMLVALLMVRLLLILSYPEYFSSLTFTENFKALLFGVRFDLSIIAVFFSPIFLALILPLPFQQHAIWRNFWVVAGLIPLWLILILSFISIGFFGEVYRHIGTEILAIKSDMPALLSLAVHSRISLTLKILGGMLILSYLWVRWIRHRPTASDSQPVHFLTKSLMSVGILLLLVLAGRGGYLTGKPINIIDAYTLAKPEMATLTLNGAFTAYHASRNHKSDLPSHDYSVATFKALQQKHFGKSANPFSREYVDHALHGKNVVLVVLESWSEKYIDSLADNNYAATPHFDEIVSKSLVYSNHYAASQRSIQSLQAILTSVPVLPSQLILSEGLELMNMPRIAELVEEEGYQTLMMQSSNRRSFRMDSIASSLGFDAYYAKEDIPMIRQYPSGIPSYGWDYETLMFFANKLDTLSQNQKPFFGFVFTGTTHEPFNDPGEEFHIRPHDPLSEDGFLNTLNYSDWSIGQFMETVKDKPWFKDTIFIFTADHVLRAESKDLREQFSVPLVIYAPEHIDPEVNEKLVSHYDLMPTLLHLMGVNSRFAAFGESVFTDDQPDEAWVNQGNLMGIIRPDVMMRHSLKSKIDFEALSEQKFISENTLEERLITLGHTAHDKIRNNLWHFEQTP